MNKLRCCTKAGIKSSDKPPQGGLFLSDLTVQVLPAGWLVAAADQRQ